MNPFPALWALAKKNSKSIRLQLTLASIVFLTSIFAGGISSPDAIWTIKGEHWALEHYFMDLVVAGVVCLIVQSLCWMDTIRPLDKTDPAKRAQLAKQPTESSVESTD